MKENIDEKTFFKKSQVLLAILSGNFGPILQIRNNTVFFETQNPWYARLAAYIKIGRLRVSKLKNQALKLL